VSVEERVIEIVSEQMGVAKDQVTRETSFVNDLGADSARYRGAGDGVSRKSSTSHIPDEERRDSDRRPGEFSTSRTLRSTWELPRRVVITGMGWSRALGDTLDRSLVGALGAGRADRGT